MIQDGRGFWEFLLHNWGCEFLGHLCMFPVIDWQTATALPPGTQHSKSSWNISVPSLRQIFVKQRVRRWTCHGMPFQRPWCQQEQLIVARPWEACGFALLFRFCDTHIYIIHTRTFLYSVPFSWRDEHREQSWFSCNKLLSYLLPALWTSLNYLSKWPHWSLSSFCWCQLDLPKSCPSVEFGAASPCVKHVCTSR
jgi:hypothetical protein